MPIHVQHAESHVAILDGDLPLTDAQVEKLVALVAERLAGQRANSRAAGVPRRSIIQPLEVRG